MGRYVGFIRLFTQLSGILRVVVALILHAPFRLISQAGGFLALTLALLVETKNILQVWHDHIIVQVLFSELLHIANLPGIFKLDRMDTEGLILDAGHGVPVPKVLNMGLYLLVLEQTGGFEGKS